MKFINKKDLRDWQIKRLTSFAKTKQKTRRYDLRRKASSEQNFR